VEGMVSLNPDIIFSYASMDPSEIEQFEHTGVPVVAVRGETFEESFEAIRLMASILDCKDNGEAYINACRKLLDLVTERLSKRNSKPLKVLFSGPKSIYSVATGSMLQTRILELSGACNVAAGLAGFWADVSPEQIARWNPDVIFLGSSLDSYGRKNLFGNPHFQTVKAIKEKKVFSFPSMVGWWDYPAPHCVLGVVWSAKTLYPDLFFDIDMMALANRFYKQFLGYSFEELGGRLEG
jgi:iron complex transport system substrate-binding protein